MRLARKLFLFTVMALSALALSATVANAQTDPEVEVEGGQHCSAVTIDVHHVEGGCHIEYESEEHIIFGAEVGGGVTVPVFSCNFALEARLDENGEGYVTYAELTPENPPSDPSCIRQPCDEVTHEMLPWPIHINEFSPGGEEMAMTFCLRGGSHQDETEGGAGNSCTVHLPVNEDAAHEYEFGNDTGRFHCEEAGLQHIFIEKAHFIDTNTEPNIEILH